MLASIQLSLATEPPSDTGKVKNEAKELFFQQGVNGYQGTVDTEIWALAPKTLLHENPNASTDANNDGGESQIVMRFGDIIGDKENQIPRHATLSRQS